MRKILVAGNWKMHGSAIMVRELLGTIVARSEEKPDVDLAVFPPFPYLPLAQKLAGGRAVA